MRGHSRTAPATQAPRNRPKGRANAKPSSAAPKPHLARTIHTTLKKRAALDTGATMRLGALVWARPLGESCRLQS